MYQSVMAQRQSAGSSGIGYAFDLVVIKELLPDRNICLAESMQYGTQYQLGLNKRGQIVWPQTGDQWVIDRSMGHWALRAKVTGNSAPDYTGFNNLMDPDVYNLVKLLAGHGLITDKTTEDGVSATPPAFTGSKNNLSPAFQQLLSILVETGILVDQTTPQTVPVGVWQVPSSLASPFSNYNSTAYQVFRYMIDTTGFVTIEGLVKTTTAITGKNTVYTLPSGFCPPLPVVFGSQANQTSCFELVVDNTGAVSLGNIPASTTISYASVSCRFATF